MKILFAEDETDLREVVTAYLEYQGYHVKAVCNGREAVEMQLRTPMIPLFWM